MAMYKVVYPDQTYALRVFRPGEHAACEREQVVMVAAHAAGLPVPEVHAAGVWEDRPVLLISWIPGRMLSEEILTRPWRLWRLGMAFGRIQAAIHAVPAPALLQEEGADWLVEFYDNQLPEHIRFRKLASGKTILLHLDFHPNNILTDGRQITGVVDWANAHAGDPRLDTARTIAILRVDPIAREVISRPVAGLFELAWRIGYLGAGGQLRKMAPYFAWAGSILQYDQARRFKDKPQELYPAKRWTTKWESRAKNGDA
jgi:aminoglycoside phosphotransferase (APT) family kinase protein